MAFRVRRRRNINAMRVGIKVGTTVLGLYAGGYFLSVLGDVMNGTASPFYKGVTLIGWTLTDDTTGTYDACTGTGGTIDNCITATSGTGILAIIGIVAIAMLVFEFVDIRM